jgi:hypothetical protein
MMNAMTEKAAAMAAMVARTTAVTAVGMENLHL